MSAVALRYAHAFFGVVASQKLDAAAVKQQLEDFNQTFLGSPELREVLMNPAIPSEQKLKVLDALSGRIGMLPSVRNFIAVIMDYQRLGELGDILNEYHVIADVAAGLQEASVTSARKLEESDRMQLETQISKLVGSRIRATYTEDSSLLGGVVVRVGSTVYDGSVRGQLQKLKQTLVGA